MPDSEPLPPGLDRVEKAEQRFFSLSLDMLSIAGFDGYFKRVNPVWSQTLGYTDVELLSLPYLALVHPEDYDATVAAAGTLAAGGRLLIFENRYRCKDGSYRWLLWNATGVAEERLIYATARDITEHKLMDRRHAAQYAVTRVLSESATLADATPKILQAISESVDWELGAMWNVDAQATLLRCLNIWPSPKVNVPEFEKVTGVMTFPPGIGLPGRVWSSKQPAWIPDIMKDTNFPRMPFAASSGIHGAFAFPVLCGNEVTGVIEFFSRKIRTLDDDLLRMMSALGSQIGQFMARKRVEEERERLILELQDALANVKTLSGLLPICTTCKKVRDDKGYWNLIEDYISAHSGALITHGICTDCARKMHPDWDEVK